MPAASQPGRGSFALLWISQAVSQLGTSISTLAYPLLILDTTGSALNAGILASHCCGCWSRRSDVRSRWRGCSRGRGSPDCSLVDTAATLVLLPLESPYAIGAAGAAAFFLAPAVSATLFGELSRRCPDELVTRGAAGAHPGRRRTRPARAGSDRSRHRHGLARRRPRNVRRRLPGALRARARAAVASRDGARRFREVT